MKKIDDSQTVEQNTVMEQDFKNERKDWNDKLVELINMLKENKKLSEAQVYQLSYRQQVQEKITEYKIIKDKRQAKFDKLATTRFREYTIGYDIKLNSTEKGAFVNADCSAIKQQVNMINYQIEFLTECIKTLDNFGFAVRNKIEIVSQMI